VATRKQIALAAALAALPGLAGAEAGAAGARAGCSVRTASVDTRGVATVVAECAWPLAPREVLATLRDPAKLASALSALRDARRLSDGRVVQVHRPGWPFEDRQVTLDWREAPLDDGGMRISYRRAAQQEPLARGAAAIREDDGQWTVRPDGAGGARVSYRSRYDAGGNLKPWLVRRFQRLGIARSLAEIRAAAEASAQRVALAASHSRRSAE
jgi:carbon monoxide dehydrogenase subunit G